MKQEISIDDFASAVKVFQLLTDLVIIFCTLLMIFCYNFKGCPVGININNWHGGKGGSCQLCIVSECQMRGSWCCCCLHMATSSTRCIQRLLVTISFCYRQLHLKIAREICFTIHFLHTLHGSLQLLHFSPQPLYLWLFLHRYVQFLFWLYESFMRRRR